MLKPTTLLRLVPSSQTASLAGVLARPARLYSTLKDTNPSKGRIPEGVASQVDLSAPGGTTPPVKESIEDILEHDLEAAAEAEQEEVASFEKKGKRGRKDAGMQRRGKKDFDDIYRRGHIDMATGQAVEYGPWDEKIAHKPEAPTVESLLKYWPTQANTKTGLWSIVKNQVDTQGKKAQYAPLSKNIQPARVRVKVDEKELVQGKYSTGEGIMAKVKQNPGFIGKEKEVMKVIVKRAPSLLQ
ncbi:hypothetical protein BJ508DRAFT_325202 [Ascobolus immersus RN42]|uniref:Uncharacterized protein n=1 Tax=Ascobolus immersus RN42 TaxID=1160509 RepID=A0A3N4IBB1_ASCIM|nr:hypothetical protein BJ508DRAFT_325202 [Ascobolus immersus RN42]